MAQVYLIPTSYVKEYSIVDENIDDKFVNIAIHDAQQQLLEPILGSKLYDKLLEDTSNATVTSDYQNLIVNKIWPYLLEAVVYKITLNLIYRLTNTSVSKDSNETSTSISIQELNVIRREREAAMNYQENKLRLFLKNNSTLYPEYNETDVEGVSPSLTVQPINFYSSEMDDFNRTSDSLWLK